jgi:hypothetical protein
MIPPILRDFPDAFEPERLLIRSRCWVMVRKYWPQ